MATPRWKEIADIFRTAIHAGELKAGDLLPSETELSLQYAVCRATAHRAMHALQQQGRVVRKRRKGTIVTGHTRRLTGHVALLVRSDRDAFEKETSAVLSGNPNKEDNLPVPAGQQGGTAGQAGSSGQ